MNWEKLTRELVCATKSSFSDLIENHRDEGLYAFVLYTDGDCYTILPSANSTKKCNDALNKKSITDPKRMAGYKWYIGEWAYEAWLADDFDSICQKLSFASEEALSGDYFAEFKKRVHACMIKALTILDKEEFFGQMRADVVIFISSTDYDEALELENSSAKLLNSSEVYKRFINRYNGV